jgi:hypothetical protein
MNLSCGLSVVIAEPVNILTKAVTARKDDAPAAHQAALAKAVTARKDDALAAHLIGACDHQLQTWRLDATVANASISRSSRFLRWMRLRSSRMPVYTK